MTDFRIRVIADPSRAKRGFNAVNKELTRTTKNANKLRTTIAGAIGVVGGGVLIGSAVRKLAEFSQSMSTVAAVTGATEQQFEDLTDTALQLGATTRFAASEAAEGMLFLARAGFTANESMEAIGGTLLLAQSGAIDLASAADIASNVLTGFRLEVEQTGRVVDVLSLAANSSNTNVRQLGDAMKFVAPVAAGLNVSIEESAAAVGALSDAGLQGSLAGTGLRRVLAELESPATKTAKILRQLGLDTNDVRVSQVGLTQALTTLRDAGVDTGLALEIFGDRGGPAFEVLSSSIPKVVQMTEELQNAGGTAERIAAIMDDNLNGALLSVRSATESVLLQFGQLGGQSALTVFFRRLAEAVRFVAINLEEILPVINGVAAALAINLVRGGINLAIAAFQRLAVVIALNPFGALATAIVFATVALSGFADEIFVTNDEMTTLQDVAVGTFNFISESLLNLGAIFGVVFDDIAALVDDALSLVNTDITGLLDATADTVKGMLGLFGGTVAAIVVLFDKLPEAMRDGIIDGLNNMLKAVERFINTVAGGINSISGKIGLEIPEAELARIDNIYQGAGEGLGASLTQGFQDGFDGTVGTIEQIGINIGQSITETANARIAEGLGVEVPGNLRIAPSLQQPSAAVTPVASPDLGEGADKIRQLELEIDVLDQLILRNKDLAEVLKIEQDIEEGLTDTQRESALARVEQIRLLNAQLDIIERFRLPQEELNDKQEALNKLMETGAIDAREASIALRDLATAQRELNFELEQATFMDGFMLSLEESLEAARNWQGEVGAIFGEQFDLMTTGFADAAAGAIVMGDSFSDAFGNVAQQALQQFISQLIQVGIQTLINAAISDTAITTSAATQTAANAQIAASAAPAAAATSLASFGANAVPALAGIAAVGAAAAALGAFQTGGEMIVGGAGGPDSQLVAFRATPGERINIDPSGQGNRRDSMVGGGRRRGNGEAGGNTINQTFVLPNIKSQPDVRRSRSALTSAAKRGLGTNRGAGG